MKTTPHRYLPKQRGFTLVEIMIVVGILGIVISMAIPSFNKVLQKEGIRKAMADVVEGCSQARAQAILRNKPALLIFRMQERTFQVTMAPTPPPPQPLVESGLVEEAPTPQQTGSFFSSSLPDGVDIELIGVNFQELQQAEEVRVRFFPNGTCDEFTVLLRSIDGGYRQITLDPITGQSDIRVVR